MLLIWVMFIWFASIVPFTLSFAFVHQQVRANDNEVLVLLGLSAGNRASAIDVFWAAIRARIPPQISRSLQVRLRTLRASAWGVGLSGIGLLLSLIFPTLFEAM